MRVGHYTNGFETKIEQFGNQDLFYQLQLNSLYIQPDRNLRELNSVTHFVGLFSCSEIVSLSLSSYFPSLHSSWQSKQSQMFLNGVYVNTIRVSTLMETVIKHTNCWIMQQERLNLNVLTW